jgi:hypothetical protein
MGAFFRVKGNHYSLVFSDQMLKSPKKFLNILKKAKKTKWLAGGDLAHIIEHELGHSVGKLPYSKTKAIPQRFARSFLRKNPATTQGLSSYATTDAEEAWSEAWARIRNTPVAQLTSYERKFRDQLLKSYSMADKMPPPWLEYGPRVLVTPPPPAIKVNPNRAKAALPKTAIKKPTPGQTAAEFARETKPLYGRCTQTVDGTVQCHSGVAEIKTALGRQPGVTYFEFQETKWDDLAKLIDLGEAKKTITNRDALNLLEDIKDFSVLGHSFIKKGAHYIDPYLQSVGVGQAQMDALCRYLEPIYEKLKMTTGG